MKFGNLKVGKSYNPDGGFKWAVFGRHPKTRQWVILYDDQKEPKQWLIFDLQFDACCYLQGFVDWQKEEMGMQHTMAAIPKQSAPGDYSFLRKKITVRKAKKKMANASRKRNRH